MLGFTQTVSFTLSDFFFVVSSVEKSILFYNINKNVDLNNYYFN